MALALGSMSDAAQTPSTSEKSGSNALYDTDIYAATSKDGLSFTYVPKPVAHHAAMPDLVEITHAGAAGDPGTLRGYFVDASHLPDIEDDGLAVSTSTDGAAWSEPEPVRLIGKPFRGVAMEPSIVELPDGKLRLYFVDSDLASAHNVYSAVSLNGIDFDVEPGVRFQMSNVADPDVVRMGDQWLMLLSHATDTLLAHSPDGLTFALDKGFWLSFGNEPTGLAIDDHTVRIFVTAPDGIASATFEPLSPDEPKVEAGVRISGGSAVRIADPACIRRSDGSDYLLFTRRSQPMSRSAR